MRALSDAIQAIPVQRALILSVSNDADFEMKGVSVRVRSIAEWLVQGEE